MADFCIKGPLGQDSEEEVTNSRSGRVLDRKAMLQCQVRSDERAVCPFTGIPPNRDVNNFATLLKERSKMFREVQRQLTARGIVLSPKILPRCVWGFVSLDRKAMAVSPRNWVPLFILLLAKKLCPLWMPNVLFLCHKLESSFTHSGAQWTPWRQGKREEGKGSASCIHKMLLIFLSKTKAQQKAVSGPSLQMLARGLSSFGFCCCSKVPWQIAI